MKNAVGMITLAKIFYQSMNKTIKFLSILACCLIFALNLFAQQAPVPDFANTPMLWEKSGSQLSRLQKEEQGFKGKIGKAVLSFDGTASGVRATNEFAIVIKISEGSMAGMDPLSLIKFFKMDVKKKSRDAEYIATKGLTGYGESTKNQVKFDLKKLHDDVYEIVPDTKLPEGEYVLMIGTGYYSFGVGA